MTIYQQFALYHYASFLDECIDLNRTWANFFNIFITKKEDFIKMGDFVFCVLLELDKKYNLKLMMILKFNN